MDGVFLETARLVLRRLRPGDVDVLVAYRNDPEVHALQGWAVPYARSAGVRLVEEMAHAPALRRGGWTQLGIERRAAAGLVGDIGIELDAAGRRARLGYTLARAHWRRGYATEVVTAVVEHLFAHEGVGVVRASTLPANVASAAVLRRAGFTPTGPDGDEDGYECRPASGVDRSGGPTARR